MFVTLVILVMLVRLARLARLVRLFRLVRIVRLVNYYSFRLLVHKCYFVEFIISRAYNRSSLNWHLCFEFMTEFEFVLVELEIASPNCGVIFKLMLMKLRQSFT
jgi:hypothetical protein